MRFLENYSLNCPHQENRAGNATVYPQHMSSQGACSQYKRLHEPCHSLGQLKSNEGHKIERFVKKKISQDSQVSKRMQAMNSTSCPQHAIILHNVIPIYKRPRRTMQPYTKEYPAYAKSSIKETFGILNTQSITLMINAWKIHAPKESETVLYMTSGLKAFCVNSPKPTDKQ